MIDKYVLATNDDGDLAIRTVSATESSSVTDTTSVITATDDGKLAVRVVGAGGGGDQHNLGWYATQAALEEAHPTAEAGDWAIVGSTDTVWLWDTDNEEWVDSDQKGQVTSVNGQTGDVVLDLLPSQTGQSGKFLTTDGTDASWSDKPLVNTATDVNSITIGGTAATWYGTNIGIGSQVGNAGVAIGHNATTEGGGSVAVGQQASAKSFSVVIGASAKSNQPHGVAVGQTSVAQGESAVALGFGAGSYTSSAKYTISLGYGAQATATSAIQLGKGTNNEAGTFCVALNTIGGPNDYTNYKLLNSDGTIPKERLTNVVTTPSTAPVLAVADWSSNTQTITVTGVTATNTVFVAPAPASAADYAAAGILCTAQAADSLTFTCTTVPTNAITLSVVILG